MKIAVIAANGKAGQAIVLEALNRGHEVTAFVRGKNKTKADKVLVKDLFDLKKEDLAGFDVVVTAFGVFDLNDLPQHITSLEHLAGLLENTSTRLLVVGGAGSLYLDESLTSQLYQTSEFPKAFFPLAKAMADGLERLRDFSTVNWTYISPAADFVVDAPRTGDYILAGEVFTLNEKGESRIGYADYALAVVDEIESKKHLKQRISVVGK